MKATVLLGVSAFLCAAVTDIESWLSELDSPDRAESLEAQVRLAYLAPQALRNLDRAAENAPPFKHEKIKAILDIALRKNLTWAEIGKWPRLRSLAKPIVDRGFRVAAPFEDAEVLDLGEAPLLPPGATPGPPSPVQTALNELGRMGGFSVPAAERLCSSSHPVARAYGVLLLRNVGATVQVPRVEKMASDSGSFEQHGSDWSERATVAEIATEALRSSPLRPQPIKAIEFESYLGNVDSDLINGIRETSAAFEASSFEKWWDEARPAWRKWWGMTPAGATRPDRNSWLEWVNTHRSLARR